MMHFKLNSSDTSGYWLKTASVGLTGGLIVMTYFSNGRTLCGKPFDAPHMVATVGTTKLQTLVKQTSLAGMIEIVSLYEEK